MSSALHSQHAKPTGARSWAAQASYQASIHHVHLADWDAASFRSLEYSYGLAGVDQAGNYRWVDMFLIILSVCAISLLALRITGMAWKHTRHLSVLAQPDRQAYWTLNRTRWWPWLNRHVLMAPLHKKRHNATFQISSAIDNGTLPGRWHTIMLILYVCLNLAWCLALPWSDKDNAALVAALRGRTGALAALNLMPTVLFALRNNPLIGLLHVSYDDFNLFHRWGARIVILESVVHVCAWVHNTAHAKGWSAVGSALQVEPSYTWGLVAVCCFVFIGIQAWSPFRHAFYETFLNIHRLCVLFALVGVYLHLEKHHLPQLPWIVLVLGFWAMEHALRCVWMLYYSVGRKGLSTIHVEAMPGEAVRVTIDLRRDWQPKPGCHVHMYMPRLALWSSHPFSVAWAHPQAHSPILEKDAVALEAGELPSPHVVPTTRQISLVCRARTGFTRKMYDRASASESSSFTTRGLIEGPYGGHHSLDSFGTAILFAGGVGITHQVMYLEHLVRGYHNATTASQRILLCWTVPDTESLEWVRPWMDHVLRLPSRKSVLRIKLFISRPKGRVENSRSASVQMFAGRMDPKTILADEMRTRVGAMAVTVCAGGALADGVRAAVRPLVSEGSVEFIEEAFTY